MPKRAIHEGVETLSAALAGQSQSPLTATEREELTQLRDALDAALASTDTAEAASSAPEALPSLLDEAMARLEGSHPDLTAALAHIAETLSELGI